MPCRDYYDENPDEYYESTINGLREQVSFAESALCQTLAAFQKALDEQVIEVLKSSTPLDFINYKEAGITRKELADWWDEHKRKDEESRRLRAEKERKARLKRQALAKLTKEERYVLGI